MAQLRRSASAPMQALCNHHEDLQQHSECQCEKRSAPESPTAGSAARLRRQVSAYATGRLRFASGFRARLGLVPMAITAAVLASSTWIRAPRDEGLSVQETRVLSTPFAAGACYRHVAHRDRGWRHGCRRDASAPFALGLAVNEGTRPQRSTKGSQRGFGVHARSRFIQRLRDTILPLPRRSDVA